MTNIFSSNYQSISSSNPSFSTFPYSMSTFLNIPLTSSIENNDTITSENNVISERCSFEYYFFNLKTNECQKLCPYNDIINELCYINNITEENLFNITQIFRELIKQVDVNENLNLVFNGDNSIYQIISSKSMEENKNKNISIIDFGACEEKLKHMYSLDYIIILKIDILLSNSSNIILKYEVYNPYNLEKIDLSVCNNMTINTYLPYSISDEDLDLYKQLEQLGYDLYNPNDSFYHELCTPYTTKRKTDILISDRRKDYFKNMTFCEEGCTYKHYDYLYEKVQCECLIENQMTQNIGKVKFYGTLFFKTFLDIENFSNIEVVKCFKLVFSKLGQINNYGSYLFIIFTFIFIILLTLYHINGKNRISKIINTVIAKKKLKNLKAPIKKKIKEKKKLKIIKKNNKGINNIVINKNIFITNHNYIGEKCSKINNNEITDDRSKKNILNINSSLSKKLKKNFGKNSKKNQIKKSNNSTKFLSIKKNLKINKSEKIKETFIYNAFELNSLKYEDAVKYDKRTYLQYYCSLIRQKHMILFTFTSKDDFNLLINKLSLFIFSFSLNFTVNTLFFDNNIIHKIYKTNGTLLFIYNILQIIYSMFISSFLTMILKLLALSNNSFLHLRKNQRRNRKKAIKESVELIKNLNIRFNIYYLIGLLLLSSFWYYISAFCAVYKNSQLLLFENTFSSYALSLLYPFALNLLPGIFRISALRAKNKNKNCIYSFGNLISVI